MPSTHVLYVAWGFPPSRSGGVYRALATVNAFAAAGARVTVLTATERAYERFTGTDPALLDRLDDSVRIVRVPFPRPVTQASIESAGRAGSVALRAWRRARRHLDTLPFPEVVYGPWRPALERAALAVHSERPVDLTVASANPNVDFAAADVLYRRYGVPYVMDYRDAWMLDVFSGKLAHPAGGRVDVLERRYLSAADEVWFVNEPIRAWHAERHPDAADRMVVVANGVDAQFAPHPRLAPPAPDRPLTFGYLGTASSKVPLETFAQAWRLARAGAPGVRPSEPALVGAQAQLWGYLGFYTTPGPDQISLLERYASDGLSYRGPVSKADIDQVYAGLDVLALILGSGRYVTSGKVYEYAATGLPIVSVHHPDNAASDVLRGYPLWFPAASLDAADVAAALAAAARAARSATPQERADCVAFARRFDRDLQLRPRVDSLLAAVGRPGSQAQTQRKA